MICDKDFDELNYYILYFIKMTYLNSLIGSGISKHLIKEFDDFRYTDIQKSHPNYPYRTSLEEYKHKFKIMK